MNKLILVFCVFSAFICTSVFSEEEFGNGSTKITDLLEVYSKNSGLKVIASNEVKGEAIHFGFEPEELDYSLLLTILKLNGFTAFKTDNYVEVVPNHRARIYASEMVDENIEYPNDQYLVETIPVENLCVSSLMPLVYRYSFISAQHETNSIVIVDYFSNIKMIKGLVESLDASADKQKKCEKFEMRPRPPAKTSSKN